HRRLLESKSGRRRWHPEGPNSCSLEVRRQALLEGHAGAVQARLERALLQPGDVEDLLIGQALDVAEDDEQAVLGVELRELALDRGLQARALGHGLGTGDAGLQRDHGAVVTGV